MLKITGYSDKYSAYPGDEVKFYINAENNDSYEVQLVRLIHGDTNPEGPGYKEAEIDASCNGNYQGKNQRIHGGSYIVIPQHDNLNVESFTIQAYIFPTTPDKGRQGIYEILTVSKPLKEAILRKAQTPELREIAIKEGFQTMQDMGRRLIAAGELNFREYERVLSNE